MWNKASKRDGKIIRDWNLNRMKEERHYVEEESQEKLTLREDRDQE